MSARAPHGALGAWEPYTPTVRAAVRGAAAPHVPHVSATDSATGASHPAFAPPRLTGGRPCRGPPASRAQSSPALERHGLRSDHLEADDSFYPDYRPLYPAAATFIAAFFVCR